MLVAAVASLAFGLGIEDIEEREIGGTDQPVTLVTIASVSYRKIELPNLPSPRLSDQHVYVEGKFRNSASRGGRLVFTMLGGDAEFIYADPGLVVGVMRGNNIGVGGKTLLYRNDPERRNTCYVQVSVLIPLPPDAELFALRFRRLDAKKDWRKMIKLAEWVDRASRHTVRNNFREFESYKKLRRKALAQAFCLRGEALDAERREPKLAREYYDLAMAFYDDLRARPEAEKYLLKAVEIDPAYEKAVKKLEEFGYVKFGGRYVTRAERRRLLAEQRRRAEMKSSHAEPGVAAREITSLLERARVAGKALEAARKGTSGLDELTQMLKTYSDASLGKAVTFYIANLPDPAGLKGLAAAAESPLPAVKKLVVKMLRRRGTKMAIDALADAARGSTEQEIRLEALSAIASLKSKPCIEALIGLVGAEDEGLKAAASAHLRELTGKEFGTHAEWQGWWQRIKLRFYFPP